MYVYLSALLAHSDGRCRWYSCAAVGIVKTAFVYMGNISPSFCSSSGTVVGVAPPDACPSPLHSDILDAVRGQPSPFSWHKSAFHPETLSLGVLSFLHRLGWRVLPLTVESSMTFYLLETDVHAVDLMSRRHRVSFRFICSHCYLEIIAQGVFRLLRHKRKSNGPLMVHQLSEHSFPISHFPFHPPISSNLQRRLLKTPNAQDEVHLSDPDRYRSPVRIFRSRRASNDSFSITQHQGGRCHGSILRQRCRQQRVDPHRRRTVLEGCLFRT